MNHWIQGTYGTLTLDMVLQRWNTFANAVLLAGMLHLGIVLFIGRARVAADRQQHTLWLDRVLGLLALAFLALALETGGIQDYYFFQQMWREVWLGHDPWFYAYGAFGKYPMNAYGPLFNLFALPALINPLLPKLLFATAYLLFAIGLIQAQSDRQALASRSMLALLAWFWMPYCWVEIAVFGHFDVLMGLLCAAAVHARVRHRDVLCGACLGMGVLLKLMPVVLLPFLMMDGRRPPWRLLMAAIATVALGFGISLALWGTSTFRPLLFAAQRGSHHLSIWRFLKGVYSPLGWIGLREDLDGLAPLAMLGALAWTWLRVMREQLRPAAAAILAALVTVMFYQVGFSQYYTVLFVLASYGMLVDGCCRQDAQRVWISLGCYFGWLSVFDLLLATVSIDALGMQEWIGLPTFLLGCFVFQRVDRAAASKGTT